MSSPGGTPAAAPAPSSVTLVIKNPANNEGCADFSTEAPLALTVGALKLRIAREYEGHPPPNTQRLIFSGKQMNDEKIASDYKVGKSVKLEFPSNPPTLQPCPQVQGGSVLHLVLALRGGNC